MMQDAGSAVDGDDAVFKALAAPIRRRMLDALREAPLTTGALCARFPELDRTTVLQHLRVLEEAELVTGRRIGRERHLALAPLPIKRIHDRWISDYMQAAVELLDRLQLPDAGMNGRPHA
ncbi:metalloregulator ArsR/SmtB family transcription factor [Agromyces mediolanus]|uniref:ArsR/SmtB family transcription factor n=1 Tax=Agromyces mediolanus TaxID=41986 RepID=UPI002040D0F5|nr:metalloregulator ArsR/SmtB family transcription factor [Agromyces mediolanus]MCM3658453.1 metalloregulator ArsR/SmtB family transcription factor [Agromyces mediolanus]